MMAGKKYWDVMYTLRPSTSLQMPNIELHRPGIEPGPPAWQASILPLNQQCCFNIQINPVWGHLYQILYPLD